MVQGIFPLLLEGKHVTFDLDGILPDIIKEIYDKPKWRKTETISSKISNEARCPLFPFLSNIMLEFLAR
jgi:hypothetical protein